MAKPRIENPPADQADEFEAFEELARRLVNVPKKELDEKRKKDQAKKA